jgi:hypothetical protein
MLTFTVVAFRSGVTGTTVSAHPGSLQPGPRDRAQVVDAGTSPALAEQPSLARQEACGVTQTGTNRLLLPASFYPVDGSAVASCRPMRARHQRHFAGRPSMLRQQGRQRLPVATH